jgi:hypothetical protein
MTSREFSQSGYEDLAYTTVNALKTAAMYVRKPEIFWYSLEDNEVPEHMYNAFPLSQQDEDMDITDIGSVPMWRFENAFNKWLLIAGERPDADATMPIYQYFLDGSQPIRTKQIVLENTNDLTGQIDQLRIKAETTDPSALEEATPRDASRIALALLFLNEFSEEFREVYHLERSAMTLEERRLERAKKFRTIMSSEVDKTKQTNFWLVDSGMGLVFLAKSNDQSIATAIIDEHVEKFSGAGLMMSFTEPLEDEYVQQFEQLMEDGREFVRIIPYSRVPWPDDPNNMTIEQRAAFDRLK